MKLIRIEGPPLHVVCAGCSREGIAGSEPYPSASTGEERTPEEWYREEVADFGAYCAACAVKMVEVDPTRAVNQFYSDTAGNEIEPENLPDL
jgi:hypothetical protein